MYDRILIPTDGSETAELAVDSALEIAERFGEMGDLKARAENATRYVVEQGKKRGLSVMEHFSAGQLHRNIIDLAEGYDINSIVPESHGRSGVRRMLLGSVTERVLRSTHRSVLVVDDREGR
ncbi:universal stress protein [Haladaptatus caseinilyticus]|uniref:universal stress protein n=1 Tax=Haladaptatus caseinilyticus TaxID=2993314 RepID=UPI00224A4CC3|nr:universal stress protein [Haladaptatus caseinilyticus]